MRLALAMAILFGLFAAYIGAYWWINHTSWGIEFTSTKFEELPPWVRETEETVFAPAKKFEHWWGESWQKKHVQGEWRSTSGNYRAQIDHEFRVTVWGLSKEGFPDGASYPSTLQHWGVARAYLLVLRTAGTYDTTLEVFVDDENRDLLSVQVAKPGGYAVSLQRVKTATP